jgi:hypothetical protein
MLTRARWARIAALVVAAVAAGSLSVSAAAAAPANDSFTAAELVTGRTASLFANNNDATKEAGEPDHADEPGGASIWYAWTAPADGRATVSTCFTPSLDTVLAVYTGDSLAALNEVAADDDGCGAQSIVTFQAGAGTVYRIAVDGVAGQTGDVAVELRLAPLNDDFGAAEVLAGDGGSIAGMTVGASTEDDEPEHYFGSGYPSVWYSWTAPSSGWATFETCGSGYDSVLAVYVGSQLTDLANVAADDDGCAPGSRVSFEATAGTAYAVAVAGYAGSTGEFTLAWNRNPPPPEPPYAMRSPRLPSAAREGETLTASEGEWLGTQPISFAYEWGRCDRDNQGCGFIAGAHSKTYAPSGGDVGWRIFVRVTATNAAGSSSDYSNLTGVVAARPPINMVVPSVSGQPRPGEILVATTGEWSGVGPISLTYQWQSCDAAANCSDLAGSAGPVLRVAAAQLGTRLRVVVTATNAGGSASAASDTTARVRAVRARGCVVPNVRRKPVAAARRAIRRAGCSTGRIRRSYSAAVRPGRVISQSPRPGARRNAGARVNLVLSKGKKR